MRIVLVIPLAIVAAAGAGYLGITGAGANPHSREMLFAAIVCLIASELAIVPLYFTRRASQATVAQAALASTVIHLFACAALGGGVILARRTLRLDDSYVYWLLALYAVTLIVLVMVLVRAMKSAAVVSVKDSSRTGLQP